MVRTLQPSTLEKQAFKAIGCYIRETGCKLIRSVCSSIQSELKLETELDFHCLGEYLHGSLPRVLATNLFSHVLHGIAEALEEIPCTTDGFKTTGDEKCKDVIRKMIIVAISPHLTCLDLSEYPQFIREVLYENLESLLKLEVFVVKACHGWDKTYKTFLRDLCLLQNLVSFNMENQCTNEIINVLGQNCAKLKRLDITGAIGVTDACIDGILKLKHLDHLQVSATSISEDGFIKLWNEMIKVHQELQNSEPVHSRDSISKLRPHPMKSLGCSYVRNSQLTIMSQFFPCLTHICFSTIYCDMSILKVLENLRELKVSGGNFDTDNIKGLLEERGSSLHMLDLLLIQHVDLKLIGRCCNELKVFNLRSCSFSGDMDSRRSNSILPFQNLESLTFYVQCSLEFLEFILINCRKVRVITVGLIKELDDNFMERALNINPMKELERMKVYFSSHLSMRTVNLLIKQCPHLCALGGLETWEGISKEELSHLREKTKIKNLIMPNIG